MAEILIRGMNKPHNCFCCYLSYLRGERLFCRITKDEVLRSKIASDCPLVELPEHGDLIDRSELNNSFESSDFDGEPCDNVYSAICVVNSMPVIVPSNKEESE